MIEDLFILFIFYSQIWLCCPGNDRHFGYEQKNPEKHTE